MDNQKYEMEFKERRAVDARIVRLEQVTENLVGSINKLTSDIGILAGTVRDSNKTNWGVMATWAGVVLMVILALSNGYVGQPLRNLDKDYASLSEKFVKHTSDGHPKTVIEKIEGINNHIKQQIQVVNDNVKLKDDSTKLQLKYLKEELDRLRGWQEKELETTYLINKHQSDAK